MIINLLNVIFFILQIANGFSQRVEDVPARRELPAVEALTRRVEREQWPASEAGCRTAWLHLLRAVANHTLWAVWAWESMQPPVSSMYGAEAYVGNFDQCVNTPWSAGNHPELLTQYCLVEIYNPGGYHDRQLGPFDDARKYYMSSARSGRTFRRHFLGACVPAACGARGVRRVARALLALSHLPGGPRARAPHCHRHTPYPPQFYLFWSLVGLLMATTVTSTIYRQYTRQFKNSSTKQNVIDSLTNCFCLHNNYQKLFTVRSDEIRVLHGMRFISAVIVVFIHDSYFHLLCPSINGLDLDETFNSRPALAMMHLEVVVDTFLAMSGLLIVRGLLTTKQKNIFYTLIKRYLRLVGPFAFIILYTITSSLYVDDGPFWNKLNVVEIQMCKKYWWKSLLMMNDDVDSLCHVTLWYVCCDFQLAIFATFLFYLFERNKMLSVGVFALTAVSLTMNLGFNVYSKRLDVLPFNYKSFSLYRDFKDLRYTYFTSHSRIGSYIVGMIMGYVVATYKPTHYRTFINKEKSIIISTFSILVMGAVGSLGLIFTNRPYDPLEAAVVVATNRVLWAGAVCCIIAVCEYGTLPLISKLLGWSGFVPFSKLTYCLYILHPIFIQLNKFNARTPLRFTIYSSIHNSCGVIVFSLAASFVLHLILEAPLINIANALFSERKHIHQENNNINVSDINGSSSRNKKLQETNKDK